MAIAEVFWISGPVVKARAQGPFRMKEAVSVGEHRLAGEVIRLEGGDITVQVFEDTTGLRPGARVEGSGQPLAVELGPGLLGQLFDGIQRPLQTIAAHQGDFIDVGLTVPSLDRERRWPYKSLIQAGDHITGGSVIGEVQETADTVHRVLAPPYIEGECLSTVEPGEYSIETPLAVVRTAAGEKHAISMLRRWPIRAARPCSQRLTPAQPLLTGQRILDMLFPVGKGGTGAMPGGFGTGKTVLQQTLAKWCGADVIVYIGCGERGNEMAELLQAFPTLEDPRTGRRLMERTVMIANTSNMPVAAREASIYTGITLAEFFRDHGLHVALLADSISRWAEALREISGRLEELPAEEGYPAYLPTRLAEFFERAGRVVTLAGQESSLTVIGAVSPPGGDFSEPVTAHSQRFVKSFWALDRERARARFYPAIHPLDSHSGYIDDVTGWWKEVGGLRWVERRKRILELLQQQARLEKMVKIVGRDALAADQRLTLVCAEMVAEALLRQSAHSETDRYCVPEKQVAMLNLLDRFLDLAGEAVAAGIDPDTLPALAVVRRLQRMGEEIPNEQKQAFDTLTRELEDAFAKLQRGNKAADA